MREVMRRQTIQSKTEVSMKHPAKRKYDFAGWVTKNDIRCSDGVTIKQDAFSGNDGTKVPLVWNHDYKTPSSVLGHMMLKNVNGGIYGYGYLNETENGIHAKEMIRAGDIVGLSIGARNIKRQGNNVVHGKIYEVSLVLSGANPGAMIDSVVTHSDDGVEDEETAIIYPGSLLHSADDIVDDDFEDNQEEERMSKFDILLQSEQGEENQGRTIEEIIDTMNDEQLLAVQHLLHGIANSPYEDDDDDDAYDEDLDGEEEPNEEEPVVKHNIFSANDETRDTLTHSEQASLLQGAMNDKVSSLNEYLIDNLPERVVLQHSGTAGVDYGIKDIEWLFPEAKNVTREPVFIKDTQTNYEDIINGVTKSPFSRIKTMFADLTEKEARARGYMKGAEKFEQVFKLLKRVTQPQTIYKKQKLDRDDIVDITDFDVVAWVRSEMRFMLLMEVARALMVGDGRETTDPDKIQEESIRPIISDDDFYTIKKTYTGADNFIEAVIKAMPEYRGSGNPGMYIDQTLLADIKLLKGADGRWLNGHIPTNSELASQMDLAFIKPTSFLKGKGALIVNLKDYSLGSTRGGEVTNFEDFDIDFNQYKYLIETRLSGALTLPSSAIYFTKDGAGGEDSTF